MVPRIPSRDIYLRYETVAVLGRSLTGRHHSGLDDHGNPITKLLEQSGKAWLWIRYIAAEKRATGSSLGIIEIVEHGLCKA